jgi:hypothetical protein
VAQIAIHPNGTRIRSRIFLPVLPANPDQTSLLNQALH